MSAPQIPNLLTLRGGRGGRGGRGRGGRGGGSSMAAPVAGEADAQARKDKLIQQTDLDASLSRLSAINVGYLKDPFATEFVKENSTPRRMPIINRGK